MSQFARRRTEEPSDTAARGREMATGFGRVARWMLLALALGTAGCGRGSAETLVVASPWPLGERARLEEEFRLWEARNPGPPAGGIRLDWRALDPGDDPAQAATRLPAADIVLGGPASAYVRLAREGRLAPDPAGAWRVVRRSPLGLTLNTAISTARGQKNTRPTPGRTPDPPDAALTFDDPRHDSVALAWAAAQLGRSPESWAEGYARLVRAAANPRRIGRRRGAALAALERGEATQTPSAGPPSTLRRTLVFVPDARGADWPEGVGLVRGGPHRQAAGRFLAFLTATGRAQTPPAESAKAAEAESFVADLLGATLIDAQDELWAAWSALGRARRPERLEHWMTELPPWPPASVGKLTREAEANSSGVASARDASRTASAGALLETLAEQVAPDPSLRAWLLRSWLGPARHVDRALLDDFCTAVDGRLAREPRFRSWLRAEWTEWARQRYRRVARPRRAEEIRAR